MRKKIQKYWLKISLLLLVTVMIAGCGEWLDNPLKDKETGDDINLLILDFNFFTTRMTYKLVDATDNSLITSEANVSFTGSNGNDIVDFSGEKNAEYITTEGQLELTVDPNVPVSDANPLEFAVRVEVDGYDTFTKGFQIRSEGPKTIELLLSKTANVEDSDLEGGIDINDGDTSIVFGVSNKLLKTAVVEELPYSINYKMSLTDLANLLDNNGNRFFDDNDDAFNFISNSANSVVISTKYFRGHSPEVDLISDGGILRTVLFHKLETGRLDAIQIISPESTRIAGSLNGGVIESFATYLNQHKPDVFGFALFNVDHWNFTGTDTLYETLDFRYTLAQASLEELCETGSSLTFTSSIKSAFSITGDVYYSDTDEYITSVNFIGNFPQTYTVENVPSEAVKIVFRDNNPSFEPIPPLEVENLCLGDYTVEVLPKEGYEEYQIVLRAICPDNPTVAVAPTYSGQVKIKDSNDVWQEMNMAGGVVDILGLPNKEYSLRLLWKNDWEYSTYYTEFDENGNYIHDHGSGTKVESYQMEDGRMRIIVEQKFEQDVCNDMGW